VKNLSKFIMLSSAFVGAQIITAPAMAQIAEPSGTYHGNVDVQKGLAFSCVIGLNVNSTSDTVSVSLNSGSPFCAFLSFSGNPYSYSFNSTTGQFIVHNVYVNTITSGDCAGDISATWNGTQFTIDATLPPVNDDQECSIEGTATAP